LSGQEAQTAAFVAGVLSSMVIHVQEAVAKPVSGEVQDQAMPDYWQLL